MSDRRRIFGRRRITSTFFWFAWFAIVILAFPVAADPLAVEPLQIVTASGTHVLRVEVARTAEEQEKGLMFRRSLPADHGMLFELWGGAASRDVDEKHLHTARHDIRVG